MQQTPLRSRSRTPSLRHVGFATTLLLLAWGLGGCLLYAEGSGATISREFSFQDFRKLRVGYGFQVTLQRGDIFKIAIEVDQNLLPFLAIQKEGDTLWLGKSRAYLINPSVRGTLKASVTMPTLEGLHLEEKSKVTLVDFPQTSMLAIDISGESSLEATTLRADEGTIRLHGAGKLNVQTFEGQTLTWEISGASHATASLLQIQRATVTINGASGLTLTGASASLTAVISGASRATMESLITPQGLLEVSGASFASLHVPASGKLTIRASGASTVHYLGSPTLEILEQSGSSKIEPLP